LRWAGKRWKLDASFKGRLKKPVREGEECDEIYASTKAHSLTKQLIWRRGDEASSTATEKVRESLWRLHVKLTSLADVAGIKSPVGIEADVVKENLTQLETQIAKLILSVVEVSGCACDRTCSCSDDKKELALSLRASLTACTREAKLCAERLTKRMRVEEIYGYTFHPNTECHCCKKNAHPIIGWLYRCPTCNVDLCSNPRCIASHPLDHHLTLIRSPAPDLAESAVVVAAKQQQWVVNSIMDRFPIPKKRNDYGPRRYKYHVQWQGKGLKPSWEHGEDLNNPTLVAQYDAQFARKTKRLRDESR
jgi:hypothetical protein